MSFYFYLLFFKQYLHSALSLNCLRGPIPQYHCRSFTGITPELKVCSTERKRSMVELSAIFLWYTIITQVGRRLVANCQQALWTDFLICAKKGITAFASSAD